MLVEPRPAEPLRTRSGSNRGLGRTGAPAEAMCQSNRCLPHNAGSVTVTDRHLGDTATPPILENETPLGNNMPGARMSR